MRACIRVKSRDLRGGYWNDGGMFENNSPDKKLLDEIAPDVPVYLHSQSCNSVSFPVK